MIYLPKYYEINILRYYELGISGKKYIRIDLMIIGVIIEIRGFEREKSI